MTGMAQVNNPAQLASIEAFLRSAFDTREAVDPVNFATSVASILADISGVGVSVNRVVEVVPSSGLVVDAARRLAFSALGAAESFRHRHFIEGKAKAVASLAERAFHSGLASDLHDACGAASDFLDCYPRFEGRQHLAVSLGEARDAVEAAPVDPSPDPSPDPSGGGLPGVDHSAPVEVGSDIEVSINPAILAMIEAAASPDDDTAVGINHPDYRDPVQKRKRVDRTFGKFLVLARNELGDTGLSSFVDDVVERFSPPASVSIEAESDAGDFAGDYFVKVPVEADPRFGEMGPVECSVRVSAPIIERGSLLKVGLDPLGYYIVQGRALIELQGRVQSAESV